MLAKLSATALKDFRSCPQRFRLRYVEGIRPKDSSDSQRMGTNWGKLHEIYGADPSITAIIEHLNTKYKNIPNGMEPVDWECEKLTLLTCFIAYQNFWKDDPITVESSEDPFEFQLGSHVIVGKLDHKGKYRGRPFIIERKSTSRSLDAASDYWNVWQRDLQISLYYLTVPAETGILLDVWRKPTIRMTKKETPQTYAERLAGDILERPDHYFARRELARTERDVQHFEKQLVAMERSIKYAEKAGVWYENEASCYEPYPCSYRGICHGPGAEAVIESGTLPPAFCRLTVKGQEVPVA